MALTLKANGTGASNLITAQWFNDPINLFTGAMSDQPITFKTSVAVKAISGPPGAPTLALTSGSNLGTGIYQYAVTFVDSVGGETLLGTSAQITTTSGNQAVNLSAIPTASPWAAKRNLYRTKVGGSAFFLLATLSDNTTTIYTDTTADASLSSTVPPTAPTFGGTLRVQDQNGNNKLTIAADGTILFGGKLGYLTAGDTIDTTSSNDTYLKARGGNINFQPTNGTNMLSMTSAGAFNVAAGTIIQGQHNHLLNELSINNNPPTLAAVSGAGLGTGAYTYGITYLTADGGESIVYSSASVTTTSGNNKVNLTNIPLGSTGTTKRNIYRSKVGTSTPLYLLTTLNDNTTTTYSDTTADTSLPATQPPAHSTFGGSLTLKNGFGTTKAQLFPDGAVSFDTGNISSNGSGLLSLVGLVVGSGLMSVTPHVQTVNGNAGGTFSVYEYFTGPNSLKIVVVEFANNYKNTGGAVSITLAQPFQQLSMALSGGITPIKLLSGGTAKNISIITALATSGGSSAGSLTLNVWSIAQCPVFDTIQEPGAMSGTVAAPIIFIGI